MKMATEIQRREARKLIQDADAAHRRNITERHTTKAFAPTSAQILAALKSGKFKLNHNKGQECRCASIYTRIGDVIDFGQHEEKVDREGVASALKKLEAARAKAVAAVTLAETTGDKLLPIVEEFRTAKF